MTASHTLVAALRADATSCVSERNRRLLPSNATTDRGDDNPEKQHVVSRMVCYDPAMGVRNYLIEGVSGVGKTSVCKELQRRGYHAINA